MSETDETDEPDEPDEPVTEPDETVDDEAPAPSSRRPVVLAAAGVVVVLVVAAVGIGIALHRHGRLPADAAFRYDGHTYLESDLAHYGQLQHALYGLAVPDLTSSTQRRAAAQTYAVSLVVDHAAAQAGVSVSSAEVSVAESDFITRAYPSGRASFINALAAQGLSEQDVLDELRRQLVIKQLYDTVTQDVTVAPAAVTAAYQAHPSDFTDPETRQVSEIVVGERGAALRLKGSLSHGASFAAAARASSLDSTTASKGGALGYVAKAQLQGPFGTAAFAAKPGHVFGPIKASGAGYYYLGLVTAVRPAHTQPLAQVRSQLSQELAAARGLSTWQAYLQKQITAAHVEYGATYRPADPDAVPGGELPSAPSTTGPGR